MADDLFRVLIETIPLPVFYKDHDGRYRELNRRYEEFVGLPRSEIVDRTVWDMWEPAMAAVYDRADRQAFRDGQQVYETQLQHHDGSIRDVVLHKAVVRDADGETRGLVGVFVDITAQKAAERQLVEMASTDQLTGLANRSRFYDVLTAACGEARRAGTKLGVLVIDLDGFKAVNDTHGHEVGDEVLREVARRLRACTRSTDLVARLGGDEFVIVVPDVGTGPILQSIAGRLVDAVTQPIILGEVVAEVGLSVGVSVGPTGADETTVLVGQADEAMYQAKAVGGSCFWFHGRPRPGAEPVSR